MILLLESNSACLDSRKRGCMGNEIDKTVLEELPPPSYKIPHQPRLGEKRPDEHQCRTQ